MNYKNPFIKVEWEDTPENLTQERIKRVKEYFKKKYNAADVKIVTKVASNNSNTKLKSLDVSDNITDPQYQKNLVKDFITENKIDIKWEMIDRLDNKINGEIDKLAQNKVRYNKWYIKKIEFSNFLSFGDDNVLDIDKLEGVTTIEGNPKNFSGKSTVSTDLLMYLFFNSTTKGKTALEVFNKFRDCDVVKVKGYIVIDEGEYIIERTITRKKSKTGEFSTKSELEFYKMSADGNPINLAGEQRRETEVFITSAIGTEEDFLATILTTGRNLEDMIEFKPTARGAILTRFMGLESLKVKKEACKTMYNEWSKKLVSNTYNIVQLTTDNENHNNYIDDASVQIVKLGNDLENYDATLKELETKRDTALQSKNNDIDKELINTNPTLLKREIDELKNKQTVSKTQAEAIKVIEPSKYYSEDDHEKLKKEINDAIFNDKLNSDSITRNENIVKQLETGSVCPTCKRPLADVDHSKEISEGKTLIQSLYAINLENKTKIESLKENELVFSKLKTEYDEYERNKLRKAKYELEVEQKQLEIDRSQTRLNNYDNNKLKLEHNQKIDGEIIILKTKIDTINANIRITTASIEKYKTEIINVKEKIKLNLELIKKIKSEEELISVFKVYLMIFGKNGISKVILRNMMPLLNQELHRLLADSCNFTVELNINDKNELEFLMIDNETRIVKPLNSGSGYEKTIASLAIRSVLTKVSSLPKPNIVVMDEIFKGVADENLELIGEFFKKIKNYFEHIFVISHNPLIRNWSDNLIMVKKDDNVSSIESVTMKIS
jgi:DNA repair exonuclease SbcCD ATPase subunit